MDVKTILLVEDNSGDELLTLLALRSNNIPTEMVVAHNGVQALDYLFATGAQEARNFAVMPDLVLLELKLLSMDGIEVLKRIRADERTKLMPVVVLTSSKEERDVVDSYRYGANGYVRKPASFGEFTEAVRQLGMYWLLLNESPIRQAW